MSMITSGVWEYEILEDDEEDKVAITGYTGNETDIVVPSEIDGAAVTCIEERAFFKKNITSVKLPDTLESIQNSAFAYCRDLATVDIPDSAYISYNSFTGCRKLADPHGFVIVKDILFNYYGKEVNIVVPEQVRIIGEAAFANHKKIVSVEFSGGVCGIEGKAFSNCINLSKLIFRYAPAGGSSQPFKNCPKLADKNGFIIFDRTLFGYYGDKSHVIVPNGITMIDSEAFSDNDSIISVTLPKTILYIKNRAFNNCPNLSLVKIPKHTKYTPGFDKDTFYKCPKMVDKKGFISLGNII